MRIRRRWLTRLKILLALVVLACLAGAVAVYLVEPMTAFLVAGVGAGVAIAGYVLHRDAPMLLASVLLSPILALGVYALSLVFDVPMSYLLWTSVLVFGLTVVVLTADETP